LKYQYAGEEMVFCPVCKKEYNKNQIKIEKRQKGVRTFQYVNRCPKCGTILSDI
jgi:uncharacterized Zn finger protein (UPF0148 family)